MSATAVQGRLTDKVAIITGGARGQGAAEAELFAREGARVVIADVLEDEGHRTAERIGPQARFVHHDVSDAASWQHVVSEAEARFGRLDVLVNNAGVFRMAPIVETTPELFELHYRVNQLGVFLGVKTVVEAMRRAGGGSIINISSGGGIKGGPNVIAYGASKFAVRGITRCAAIELAPDKIRVNSVHPHVVETPMLVDLDDELRGILAQMTPLGRFGAPHEIAHMVLFLASEESSYCTGGEFLVDGGATA